MKKDKLYKAIYIFINVFFIALILIAAGISIYANVKYWNTPINQVPAWAFRFMLGGS
jgi:hypothetical protein